MTRKTKRLWIITVLLLAGAAIIPAIYEIFPRHFEMTTTDPAWSEYFQQARLRRGADEQLFDLAGKPQGKADYPSTRPVIDRGIDRQLTIDLPADDTLRMDRSVIAYSGRLKRQLIAVGYLVDFARHGDRCRAVYDISIDSSFNRSYLLFEANSKVRQVDLVVKYWRGPMGKAAMTFVGPFETGKPVPAREGAQMKVTATTFGIEPVLKIEGSTYFHWSQVNGYDAKGHRYDADLVHGYPPRYPFDFLQFHGVKFSDIVAVTCTEDAYEVVFKNVPLELSDLP
jgi:hypothetical protein